MAPNLRSGMIWVRDRAMRLSRNLGFREDTFLVVLAVLIGAGTGLGAMAFSYLLSKTIHFYYGWVQGTLHISGGSWTLLLLPLLPASGGLLVGLITYFFAREAKGHGVPEVMDAIARRNGVIRPRVSLAKAVASALTIGSGGSAGTEGPIVQIGAAVGSSLGQVLRLPRGHLPVLIGCGAAAGIASIFNAPIAGVLFALEIFLYDFSFRTLTPVVLSSVVSATVTHALTRTDEAMLQLSGFRYQFHWWELGNYVVLGVLAGLVAILYIRSLYASEDVFDIRLKRVHPALRPVVGGLLLGGLGIVLALVGPLLEGQPAVFGNGYPLIRMILDPASYGGGGPVQLGLWLLLGLMAAKLLATCLTLGSGGSGGVFAPSLFMGAALGGLFGVALRDVFGASGVNPVAYAVVGMAAVFAGSTHAFLTAIVMLFEMTHDIRVMLPVMLAATIATIVSQMTQRDSIYTQKLSRRGIRMGMVADMTLLRRISAEQLPLTEATFVRENWPLSEVIAKAAERPTAEFVVTDDAGRYRGMLVAEDLRVALLEREAVPLLLARELARADLPLVHPQESLATLHDKFTRHDVHALPVVDASDSERIVGLVTRSALMRRYQQELSSQRGFGAGRPEV